MPADLRGHLQRALRLLLSAPTLEEGLRVVRCEVPASQPLEQLLAFAELRGRGLCRMVTEPGGPGD